MTAGSPELPPHNSAACVKQKDHHVRAPLFNSAAAKTQRAKSDVTASFSTLFALTLLFQVRPFFRRPADHYVAYFLSFAIHHS